MKEYIIVIAGAAILSVLADILSPDGWRKYIKIVTGFVIISVILAPVAELKNVDLFLIEEFGDNISIEPVDHSKEWVIDEFVRVVEGDIKERIKREYNKESRVVVRISVNADNQIESVDRVNIYMDSPPSGLREKIAQMYGIGTDEVIING